MLDFDDLHLIERTQQGESDAFNPLVVKYQPRIYTFISQQVKEIETAKDLTQETWLKAFCALNTFRGDSTFASWLYRIAENVCIDYFRKQQKAQDIEPLHTVDERRITQTHSNSCRDLERQELRAYLRAAIQSLTHIRKQVFLLYYAQDLSIKQIATRLNRSEGTIKTHLRNARLQLQEYLTPYLKDQHIPYLS